MKSSSYLPAAVKELKMQLKKVLPLYLGKHQEGASLSFFYSPGLRSHRTEEFAIVTL